MNKERIIEKIHGISSPQQSLFKGYVNALRSDGDRRFFDNTVRNHLLKFAKDESLVTEVNELCDSISYSSSKKEYWQIEKGLQRFEEPNHSSFTWNRNFKKAKSALISELRRADLKPLDFRSDMEIMEALPKKDTHAGYSYLLTGLRTKGEYMAGLHERVLKLEEEAISQGNFDIPLLIGTRLQASMPFDDKGEFTGKFKNKTRLVAMVDVHQIVSEMKYAKPVQQYLSLKSWYAGGKSDQSIHSMITSWRSSIPEWISIDYSGYDQSISNWLIYEAFDIVKAMFSDGPAFNERLFDVIVSSFINKTFIDGNGLERRCHKGVPSGSMFTQIIGTIVNRLMILTYLKSIEANESYEMMIMGDDNILFSWVKIDPIHLETYLKHNFGVTVNGDKSSQGNRSAEPEFLSRHWSWGGPKRNIKHILVKFLYPERFRNYAKGKAEVDLVFYSYYLAYSGNFRDYFDMTEFMKDRPNLENKLAKSGLQGLSGYLAYVKRHN